MLNIREFKKKLLSLVSQGPNYSKIRKPTTHTSHQALFFFFRLKRKNPIFPVIETSRFSKPLRVRKPNF